MFNMKHIAKIALASATGLMLVSMLIISIASAGPAFSIVYLNNPDFTHSVSGWWGALLWDGSVGHNSLGSARTDELGHFGVSRDVSIVYSGVYTFSMWIRASESVLDVYTISFLDEPDEVNYYFAPCYPVVEWSECKVTGYLPAGIMQMALDPPGHSDMTYTVWIDDALLINDEQEGDKVTHDPSYFPESFYLLMAGVMVGGLILAMAWTIMTCQPEHSG